MFVPIEIEHSYSRVPFVTIALGVALVGVSIATGFSPDERTLLAYALVPSEFRLHQLVTSSFLHDGAIHLLFNVWFLWIFGRYVEDRLGAWRFAVVYFACAIFGDLVQLAFGGDAVSLGASGAIAGLLGYVIVAAPWAEIRCVLFIGPAIGRYVEIAAVWLLGFWVVLQLVEASLGSLSDVAVGAHLGGFALGAAGAAIMRSARCKGTVWYIDPLPPAGGRAAVERLRRARA
jgi:membrane associated rhomboid family serine protease